jgi:flavin reductase (DIM6/NTAB) family NADH-FMN oxidoreductase RutF
MNKTLIEPSSGPMPILLVHPVILVGALVDDQPDFAAVAWTGVAASFPPTISISLQPRRHSLKGIKRNMSFSVNIPSIDQLKEADYCGLVSGANSDKVMDCGFKVFFGKTKSAPLIEQFPVNHICQVLHILSLGSHEMVVGKITETYISDDCLTNGKIDIGKARPFIFSSAARYFEIGDQIGKAFSAGSAINPKKVEENRKHSLVPPPPSD